MNYNKVLVWLVFLVLVAFEIYSFTTDSHYKWDFFFLIGLLWAVYLMRDKIKLYPLHFFLFSLFLIMHNLGTFGTYSNFYFGFEYDFWVHSYFGLVSAFILYRTYRLAGPYRGWFMYLAIIAVILGFSAFHELFEYAGAMTVGEGEGVLFVGAGDTDEWDTQKDMRNNLIGAIAGLALYRIYQSALFSKKSRKRRSFG
ncbi:MAG: DUF2238 domain-containing protein [Nanoarchaeota archaeon]